MPRSVAARATPAAMGCSERFSTAAAKRRISVSLRPSRENRSEHRSEEHTSELQSLTNLVCRLLLEKKKTTTRTSSLLDSHSGYAPARVSASIMKQVYPHHRHLVGPDVT